MKNLLFFSLLMCCGAWSLEDSDWQGDHGINFTVKWMEQDLDHFSYGVQDQHFMQKYLINTDHWNRSSGPIFFYTGNEGGIELFALNTGFMFDIAPEFGAMIVFGEHRYYGDSMPFGDKAYTHLHYYQYQSSMQALGDYNKMIEYIKYTYEGAENSPVVVFGGSYGGMLAAWMRMKYPNIVQGAIAASAPIAQFTGLTPCNKFGQVVTTDFSEQSADCAEVIRQSWNAINSITATATGRDWLNTNWNLCKPVNDTTDVWVLKNYLTNVWINLAEADYPYVANFLAPLPAYPVKVVCEKMTLDNSSDEALLAELFKGLTVYFNSTTKAECLAYHSAAPSNLDDNGWDLQSCTEMAMPFCYDNVNDFFEPAEWNFEAFDNGCFNRWGVHPKQYKIQMMYGGRNIKSVSNIVFSNGHLDPWHAGGILEDVNESVIAVLIKDGAHHLDLRSSERADPQSVIDARNLHRTNIQKWIKQYWEQK